MPVTDLAKHFEGEPMVSPARRTAARPGGQDHFVLPVSGAGAAVASRPAPHKSLNLHVQTNIIRIIIQNTSGTRTPMQNEITLPGGEPRALFVSC